jgi:predicted permease
MGGPLWDQEDPDRIFLELEEEREAHLQMRTEELMARGLSPDAARAEAERRFGDLEQARRLEQDSAARRARRARREVLAEAPVRWATHFVRGFRHRPGPTLVSLLVFALGVGLTTSIFTVVDHVLLRPLPLPEPGRLVKLEGVTEQGGSVSRVSMGNWVDWKDRASTLARTAIYQSQDVTVLTGDRAFWAAGAIVLGPYFETLGLYTEVGRPLTEGDGLDRAPVVAVSRDFWTRALGGDTDLASLDLTVNGRRVGVVGVVEDGLAFPGGTEVWIPAPYRPEVGAQRNNINFEAVARLGPTASIEGAERELTSIALGIREQDPEAVYSYGVRVLPLQDAVVADARDWLSLLGGAVALVLLIACANLAGLSLAQARRRECDTAVRLALGARRGQLMGDEIATHVITALLGGGLGLLLAGAGADTLTRAFADVLPRAAEVGFDIRVAAFGVAASAVAGLLAGLTPAVRGVRGIAHGLGADARGSIRGGRGLPGAVMVGTEVAIAVTLLVGGGLLLRSLVAVASRDLGYDPEGVAVLDVALTAPEYRDLDRRMAYWGALLDAYRSTPGVQAAAMGNWIPTGSGGTSFIELEGKPEPDGGAGYRVVSDDYLDVMGIPLVAGRAFSPSDALGTERVGLVNRSAAARFWPGEEPLGRRIKAPSMEAYYNGGTADWITVVGVVGDVRHFGFESDPRPELFVLHRQMPSWTGFMSAVVELRPGAPADILERLTDETRRLDARLAVESGLLTARVRAHLAQRRLILGVLGVFAAASLLLVCLGIYGLLSFAVAQRTREIAIRAALGAARGGILTLMLASALRVVVAGAAVGLVAAVILRDVLAAMVVGVGTADPLTYAGAAAIIVAVALGAALLPSLRAARLHPLEALRRE